MQSSARHPARAGRTWAAPSGVAPQAGEGSPARRFRRSQEHWTWELWVLSAVRKLRDRVGDRPWPRDGPVHSKQIGVSGMLRTFPPHSATDSNSTHNTTSAHVFPAMRLRLSGFHYTHPSLRRNKYYLCCIPVPEAPIFQFSDSCATSSQQYGHSQGNDPRRAVERIRSRSLEDIITTKTPIR